MRHNTITETVRESESGQVWEEKLTNTTGTIKVPKHVPVRVRAAGAATVTIGGVLAATMSSGEVIVFNSGDGDPDSAATTVDVVIASANCFVQVAREVKRLKKNS